MKANVFGIIIIKHVYQQVIFSFEVLLKTKEEKKGRTSSEIYIKIYTENERERGNGNRGNEFWLVLEKCGELDGDNNIFLFV